MSDEHEPEEGHQPGPPLPPDDRLWRHPSELGSAGLGKPVGATPAHPSRRPGRALWGVAAASAAIGAVATVAAVLAVGLGGATDSEVRERVVLAGEPRDPADVAEEVLPALVRLEVSGPGGTTIGTGVVLREDGHVLTTADLLAGAEAVRAVTGEGEAVEAEVAGVDARTDLAVVRLAEPPGQSASLGSATGLQEGEVTVALGAAPGASSPPLAVKAVVAETDAVLAAETATHFGMLVVSTAHGAVPAGSVVVSQAGAVVGIATQRRPAAGGLTPTSATAGAAGATTVAYITPIDYARRVADDLIAHGAARHTWLGAEGGDAPAAAGAMIATVHPDGPAARAGLTPEDRIVRADGRAVSSWADLEVALRERRPGDEVELAFVRDGQLGTCRAKLDEQP